MHLILSSCDFRNDFSKKCIIENLRTPIDRGSAGAHIASKNIEHVIPFDGNITGFTDYNGLGLCDGILFCHYTENRKQYYEKALSDGKYNVYVLSDNDSIVVND